MPASKAQRAATAKRRADAIAMKLAGLSYETIAERLDYASRGAACTDIQRALEASLRDQHRDLEVWRHELMLGYLRLRAAMWPAAMAGDTKAADVCLRINVQLSRLTGANAAIVHQVITIGAVEEEIARLSRELGADADRGVPDEPSIIGLMGGPEAGPAA